MPHKVSSRSGHSGHFEGDFRDLFPVQFSRKRSRKQGMICPECPEISGFKKNDGMPEYSEEQATRFYKKIKIYL
jgi:hypothetical protein